MNFHLRQTIDSAKFTWTGKTGVTELSDLQELEMVGPWMPTFIDVRSSRTGRVESFSMRQGRKDAEGERISWCYASKAGHRIEILND